MILQTSKEVTEGVVRRCSVKKVFLEILQNSQGSTCARVFFYNKVAGQTFCKIHRKTPVPESLF